MNEPFPNLSSDQLAMLATVEAAWNAGEDTVVPSPPRFPEQSLRLAALQALVVSEWILGGDVVDNYYVFYTDEIKVFHADGI